VRRRSLPLLLGFALGLAPGLWSQSQLTVDQLVRFIESSIKLKHPDKQVASYLQRVKLSERLDDVTIETLQGKGAGPRTLEALRALRNASAELKPPAPVTRPEGPPPIPPPSPAEQQRILEQTREYALNYSKNLPDFICTQVTRRYYDPSGLEFWQAQDTLTARLTYFEQRENYKLVLVNSHPTDAPYESLGGATSTGEFGSILREIFAASSQARFAWERWATLRGSRVHVFSYRIAQPNSQWRLSYERRDEIITGYSGLIYVERDSGAILRVTLHAEGIPPSFPIQQASTVLDYGYTTIGEQTHLLPLRAVVRMRSEKLLTKNEVEFRLYRKFAADAAITFDTPEPLGDEQLQEQPARPNP
jgi:hypothetical protein